MTAKYTIKKTIKELDDTYLMDILDMKENKKILETIR